MIQALADAPGSRLRKPGQQCHRGYVRRAQTKAAAIGVGAFGDQQNLFVQSMDTRIKHAIRLMQFKPTAPAQKEQDIYYHQYRNSTTCCARTISPSTLMNFFGLGFTTWCQQSFCAEFHSEHNGFCFCFQSFNPNIFAPKIELKQKVANWCHIK